MDRMKEIETRLAAIRQEAQQEGADLDALTKEANDLQAERKALLETAEKRNNLLKQVAGGELGTVVRSAPEEKPAEKRYGADSPEYRTAFLKNLAGKELTVEERAAFTHTTANTANALPTTMLNQIWDLVSKQHCIMGDITLYRTGTILEVVKHTAIAAGKAGKVSENAAATDEQNTFAKVTLSGNDFAKTVKISYAMAAMSIDALEAYLVNEISAQLGEALADDVISTVKTGVAAANKVTTASTTEVTYKELVKAFGLLERATAINIYVNYATLYNQLVSMTDTTGRPLFQPNMQAGAMGVLLGGTVKIEESLGAGEILIGDSKKIVYNMVQDIMVETDRDIGTHTHIYSGYARGEGALIDDKAFSLVTLKAASGS